MVKFTDCIAIACVTLLLIGNAQAAELRTQPEPVPRVQTAEELRQVLTEYLEFFRPLGNQYGALQEQLLALSPHDMQRAASSQACS